MYHWSNIPKELQELKTWTSADDEKRPVDFDGNLIQGGLNSHKLTTFQDCVEQTTEKHIGVYIPVGYFAIDVDNLNRFNGISEEDKQQWTKDTNTFLKTCKTYCEFSASGKAFHAWYKDPEELVTKGFRYRNFQILAPGQFIIVTGHTLRAVGKKFDYPILKDNALVKHYQALANPELAEKADEIDEKLKTEPGLTDEEILNKLFNAENAIKAKDLFDGNWEEYYPNEEGTGSSADMGLISMFLAYTRNQDQLTRLFLRSALANRESVKRKGTKYIHKTITAAVLRKERDESQELSDATELVATLVSGGDVVVQERKIEPKHSVVMPEKICPLLHDLTEYLFESARVPIRETAFIAATSFLAGTCGRSYNILGSGINFYFLFLANTATGKEEIGLGVERLADIVRPQFNAIDSYLGAADYASGRALMKDLETKPCMVSVMNEFKHMFAKMKDNANYHNAHLKTVLLQIFPKSGAGNKYNGTAYADTTKNSGIIQSPCLTFVGDATPEDVYESLDSAMIADGLLGRMLILDYRGNKPYTSFDNIHAPPPDLKKQLTNLILHANNINQSRNVIHIKNTNILQEFDHECTDKINSLKDNAQRGLWGRVGLHTAKLAGLLALATNPEEPKITENQLDWAKQFVFDSVNNLARKFEKGEVGSGHTPSKVKAKISIMKWFEMDRVQRLRYGTFSKAIATTKDDVVPRHFIKRKLEPLKYYQEHKLGAPKALEIMINDLIDDGFLTPVNKELAQNKYGVQARTRLYFVQRKT